jgi:hypothetical protein
MPDEQLVLQRRRTDGRNDRQARPSYRALAEAAYRLYLADGCNPDRILDYWQQAEIAMLAEMNRDSP